MHDQGWTAVIEAAGEPGRVVDDDLDCLVELLHDAGGAVSGSQDGSRYGATFTIDRVVLDPEAATHLALQQFNTAVNAAGLPSLPIVHCEVMTHEELDRELERPVTPAIAGIAEISAILGVSKQRANQLTRRPDFPEPIADLAAGRFWNRDHLNRFVEAWRAGKPDVSAEVAEADQAIADLTRYRNALMNGGLGDSPPSVTEWLLAAGGARQH